MINREEKSFNAKLKNPIYRINHDFELLYMQQMEFQRCSKQADASLVKMKCKIDKYSFAETSLHFFHVNNPLRKVLLEITMSIWFDWFILLVIILNSICLAYDVQTDNWSQWNETTEKIFLVIFTIEIILRIFAKGLIVGKYTYFRDFWNVFDFIIILIGWIGEMQNEIDPTLMRTIRLFRPLRAINSFPELKLIILSIMKSVPLLLDILALFSLVILIYAIAGTRIYAGLYNQQCYTQDGNTTGVYCYLDPSCKEFEVNCGRSNSGCGDGEYCWDSNLNLNNGVTSFDNIGISILTVLNVVFIEGWSPIMFEGRLAYNEVLTNDLFFVSLIVIGAFFLLNLIKAVLFVKFHEVVSEEKLLEKNKGIIFDEKVMCDFKPKEPEDNSGIWYCWYFIRIKLYIFIQSNIYYWLYGAFIMTNTFILSTEYYGMSKSHENAVLCADAIFTWIFFAEMVLKLIALGIKGYAADNFNIFEAFLVVFGLSEIIVMNLSYGFDSIELRFLRTARIFRFFKLARRWKGLKYLIEKAWKSAELVIYLGILCFIVLFVYAIIGVQLFKDKLYEDGEVSRTNFNNLFWAIVTTFQLFTDENWNSVWYDSVNGVGWWATVYYLSILSIGSYVLFDFFLAILLEQFEESKEEKKLYRSNSELTEASLTDQKLEKRRREIFEKKIRQINERQYDPLPIYGKSLYLFSVDSKIRQNLRKVVLHPYFINWTFWVLILAAIFITFDKAIPDPYEFKVATVGRYFTLSCYWIEIIIKVIVSGFIFGKHAYLKDGWNILDFVIVIVHTVRLSTRLIWENSIPADIYIFTQAILSFRVLRLVSRNETLKKIVTSIISAFPVLFNVMILSLLDYFMFGVVGVIYFKGAFYTCSDPSIEKEDDCTGQYFNGTDFLDREWKNTDYNFDNILRGMNLLFQISSIEDWPNFMFTIVDAVGQGQAMKRDHNQYAALFVIVFLFITTFFVVNLYIGAIVTKFGEIHNELDGSLILTHKQKEWVETQKLLLKVSPKIKYIRPKNKIRKILFDLVLDYKFDYLVTGCIVMNMIFLCLYNSELDEELWHVLYFGSVGFTVLFSIECGLKIIGLGPRYYFANKWNLFDFIIVLLSLISFSETIIAKNSITLAKLLRVVRSLRLIRFFKHFKRIFDSLLLSLPSIANVVILIFLLLFIYATAGATLWGNLQFGQYISSEKNFTDFYNSFMVLFITMTGEDWDLLYSECMGMEGCNDWTVCGNPWIAAIYWVSYEVLAAFIFMNIFIAVLLENFTIENEDNPLRGVTSRDLDNFVKAWSNYAPYGEHFIRTKYLPKLLNELEAPLGFKGSRLSRLQLISIIYALKIKEYNGKVMFSECLWALAGAVSGEDMPIGAPSIVGKSMNGNFQYKVPRLPNKSITSTEGTYAAKTLVAYVFYEMWKSRKEAREKRNLFAATHISDQP
ncbi:unnamed protein product [Blepharisma stoltei]|uniref:Ion transport domain-containing protein n=1 Tax=Blepharisma stoltei TaxID=1481888 RepID=A0AAU9K974_9CILI|nr:unnamed protein product [Blepharisma stoltei]